jgi:hypothetical protein
MKSLQKNMGIILAITIFLLVMFLYRTFLKPDPTAQFTNTSARDAGADLVLTLQGLKAITFDQALLSSQAYLSLKDFSVEVRDQPAGRSNPFNTIGRD